ncbi:MAG: tetratricopeptide repeat protein [Alistipes sp.]
MQKAYLNPTTDQTFEIIGEGEYDFTKVLDSTREMEHTGMVEEACNERFKAFQRLAELIPDNEEINLEWNHPNTQSALELIYASAVDHFLINDFELSAALLELLLDLDPEDHLESIVLLAFNYVATNEQELFDEVINDVSDKYAGREVLMLWSAFRKQGRLPEGELMRFKTRFAPYYAEFTASEHPANATYLQDIEGERPSLEAQARELWLQTENLWTLFPDFIEKLSLTK